MAVLPSLLDSNVADEEDLARFLTSSGHFNSLGAKPAAFMPNPKDRETSVFRHGSEPREELWKIGDEEMGSGDRAYHGAAIVKAGVVREAQLTVTSSEPPPRHAVIAGWPWMESDPELQRAKQKELAALIASKSQHCLR